MTSSPDRYVVAGVDLRAFVVDWLSTVLADAGASVLLDQAQTGPEVHERYGYGAAYMSQNIGPRASEPTASREELLLFAVLALYGSAGYPGADPAVWDGEEAHVDRAFAHFGELGEREAARRLRAEVFESSTRTPDPVFERPKRESLGNDPGRIAGHDQLMASIQDRSFRAAQLLDPDGDIDGELAALLSRP